MVAGRPHPLNHPVAFTQRLRARPRAPQWPSLPVPPPALAKRAANPSTARVDDEQIVRPRKPPDLRGARHAANPGTSGPRRKLSDVLKRRPVGAGGLCPLSPTPVNFRHTPPELLHRSRFEPFGDERLDFPLAALLNGFSWPSAPKRCVKVPDTTPSTLRIWAIP